MANLVTDALMLFIYSFFNSFPGFNRQRHITEALTSLHWLPVCFGTELKILLISFEVHPAVSPCCFTETSECTAIGPGAGLTSFAG